MIREIAIFLMGLIILIIVFAIISNNKTTNETAKNNIEKDKIKDSEEIENQTLNK